MLYIQSKTHAKPLKYGDKVIISSVSSAIEDTKKISQGINILEDWGLVVQKVPYRKPQQWGYLAGTDEKRFKDLHAKKQAPLQVFSRGGWGAARLLERHQPWSKGWLLGFSDISALLLSRLSAGFDGCIHGPLLNSLSDEPTWSKERLKTILFGGSVPDLTCESWIKGFAQGPLVITNLTVASHLIGSPHIPNLNGAILILEDVAEAPYRIDRMLTQWRLAGLLQKLAGVGFGDFSKCESSQNIPSEQTFRLQEVLEERTSDLGIPVVGKLPIGHCCGNAALPLGRKAILDGTKGILKLLA